MLIEWGENFCLGLEAVDAQHLELADCLNRLEALVRRGNPPLGETFTLLDNLYRHTRDHFAFEEQLMVGQGYHHLVEHRREHLMLIAELKVFIAAVRRGAEPLNAQALEALKKWLVGHIVGSDRDFAVYVIEQSGKT